MTSAPPTTPVPAPTARRFPSEWFPWGSVVAPWLVSRALAIPALLWGARDQFGGEWSTRAFEIFDGGWYSSIAQHGYGPPPLPGLESRWPFFPLLPGLWRATLELGFSSGFGIVVLNNLLLLVALAGLYRLARRHCTPRAAHLATWLLALFPASVVFSLTYPSAIFLTAGIWAFLLIEDRHDVAAGVVVLSAAMVRPNGFLLALALVVSLRSLRRIAVVCGPAVVGVATWAALNWRWTDSPFTFYTAKDGWDEVTIVEFLTGVHRQAWPHLPLALIGLVVVALVWRRLPLGWLAFVALYLLPPLVLGTVGLGRYTNECFPVFAAGGDVLERVPRWAQHAVLVASGAGLVLFTVAIARWHLTP